MKLLGRKIVRFVVSEDGPTAVEYAVMLSLIIIVCMTAVSGIGAAAKNVFKSVSTSIGH